MYRNTFSAGLNLVVFLFCFALVSLFASRAGAQHKPQIYSADKVKASNRPRGEEIEKIFSFWSLTMEQTRVETGADKEEFGVFQRFCRHTIDSVYLEFMNKLDKGDVTVNNVAEYMGSKKPFFTDLFKSFRAAEDEYPSSVNEYKSEHRPHIGGDSCFSFCYNTDFNTGFLDGWYGYYAVNASGALAFNYTNVTGGYLGHVQYAAQDPFTGNDYQIRITGGAVTDPFLNTYSAYQMPEVSPWGGANSVMIGDSSRNGQGMAILSQSFLVTPANANLTYQYALFLENPTGHTFYEQPFFVVAVLDAKGDTIPICGQYNIDAINGQSAGFKGIWYPTEFDSVYWKDWTLVNVPLKHYIGQCVTVIFQVQDCSLGGHFGYAYVDATCSPLGLITSSPNICGTDSISLTAPPGNIKYTWTGPLNGIRGADSLQTVWVDSAGTYQVIAIPVTGISCADTLSITVNKLNHKPPHPDFFADTACLGQPTVFTNTSNPDSGASFLWDFYNIGINVDSIANPTWFYSSPGVYSVKITEIYQGCGADTVIQVKVDSGVVAGFTMNPNPACLGDTITMTNTSANSKNYYWNFGDPKSGNKDTSTAVNVSHFYADTGTYTITLAAKFRCNDTIKQTVTIVAPTFPIIKGRDSICLGYTDTLSVTGGLKFVWSNGSTASSIRVSPGVGLTTYSVAATSSPCSPKDTTFTVKVVPPPAPAISASKNPVCAGAPDTLKASGAATYKWSNGSNATSIIVTATKPTTYTVYSSRLTCLDSAVITIGIIPLIYAGTMASPDTICRGMQTTLFAADTGGPATYKWSTGVTGTSATVMPDSTITYYVIAQGICNKDSVPELVHVIQLPKPKITGRTLICAGFGDTLFANGGAGYKWSDGTTKTSYIISKVNANISVGLIAYNVTGKDTCFDSTRITVNRKAPPTIYIPDTIVCSHNCVPIRYVGIQPGYTLSWDTGCYTCGVISTSDTVMVCPDTATTYYLTVSNGCVSQKRTIVPTYLKSLAVCCDTVINRGDTAYLSSFLASKYSWSPSTGLKYISDSTLIATPTVTTTYTVTGIDANHCLDVTLVTVQVEIPCFDFVVPNVFTPGNPGSGGPLGTGVDNIFYIKTTYAGFELMDGWSVLIYDRWGKEMFKSTNPQQYWDGKTEGGSAASDGVYYYIISATCQGKTYKKTGFVQLIR